MDLYGNSAVLGTYEGIIFTYDGEDNKIDQVAILYGNKELI